MTLTYDLFWSFRSPYSYLVVPRLIEFERDYDVKANVRPVYPIAVRIDGFFKNADPMWGPYIVRDSARTAQMIGLPFAWPSPDPVAMNLGTGEVPKQQPYISRLTRLGVAAAERGRGLQLLREVSRSSLAARATGISATTLRERCSAPVSTLPSSTETSKRTRSATRPSSLTAKPHKSVQATGACR
jgi:hypothetical protein